MQTSTSTRDALLEAAAELFAEHGFEGASIRRISEKAGANVAAIHYHFGSKEKLYAAAVVAHCKRESHAPLTRFLDRGDASASLDDVREVLRLCARSFLEELAADPGMAIHRRLLLRTLFESHRGPLEDELDHEFRADVEDWMRLARMARPDLTERDAMLWAYAYMGQVTLYFLARDHILRQLGVTTLDDAVIEEASTFIADAMTSALVRRAT